MAEDRNLRTLLTKRSVPRGQSRAIWRFEKGNIGICHARGVMAVKEVFEAHLSYLLVRAGVAKTKKPIVCFEPNENETHMPVCRKP